RRERMPTTPPRVRLDAAPEGRTTMAIHVEPGTIVLYSDIACGWATLALHRFYAARADAGLEEAVRVDHRLFLLEDVNRFPLPKSFVDAEIPVFADLAPDFGFRTWRRTDAE